MFSGNTRLADIERIIHGLGPKSCMTATTMGILTIDDLLKTELRLPGVNMDHVRSQLRKLVGESVNEKPDVCPSSPSLPFTLVDHTWFNKVMYLPVPEMPGTVRRVIVQELIFDPYRGCMCKVKWYDGTRWVSTQNTPQYMVHIWFLFHQDFFLEYDGDVYRPQRMYQQMALDEKTSFPLLDISNDEITIPEKWLKILIIIEDEIKSMYQHFRYFCAGSRESSV